MQLKKLSIAVIAGMATLLAAGPALADDDDDDWKERRRQEHKRKGKREIHHHHYYYSPPVVIYRNTPPAPPAEKPGGRAAPSFPMESTTERSLARERQREILEKELATESQLLAEAKRKLDQDSVGLHEKNIEALTRELKNLNR